MKDLPVGRRVRALALPAVLVAATALAGCGGSGNTANGPTILPARTYQLVDFKPATPVRAGHTTLLSFSIRAPSGKTITAFKKCCEPHTGVDLIIVRSDDSHVQYDDSDITPNGHISQPVVFPAPGRYRIVVDVYPKTSGPSSPFNFQLFTSVTVRGAYHPQPLPAYKPVETIAGGYRFQIEGRPKLKAIDATFIRIRVTDAAGHKAVFPTWRGALAHAIFFHKGSLAYSHTHVCGPGSTYCFSALGSVRVTGLSSSPGVLKVGVLLPEPGVWRLFLITHLEGRVHVAPFTLTAT